MYIEKTPNKNQIIIYIEECIVYLKLFCLYNMEYKTVFDTDNRLCSVLKVVNNNAHSG